MTGADIIGALLLADAGVIAKVLPRHIKAGRLADGIGLPSLLVRVVSVTDRQALRRAGWERSTARVSVTVRAKSYREQNAVMKAVRQMPRGAVGTVDAAENVVVLTAGLGPDVNGPGDTFEQTQDFRVSFDALI